MTATFAIDFHNKITDVEESDRGLGTTQVIFTFANGYKASVIQGPYTYGGDDGLYEMGVLDPQGNLNYDNPVTPDDVAGYLDSGEVVEKLRALANLTAEELTEFRNEKAKVAFRRALELLAQDFQDIREKSPDAIVELPTELRTAVEGVLNYFDTHNTEENNA